MPLLVKQILMKLDILKKKSGHMWEFQDSNEISGISGHILKFQEFQEFQDRAQACLLCYTVPRVMDQTWPSSISWRNTALMKVKFGPSLISIYSTVGWTNHKLCLTERVFWMWRFKVKGGVCYWFVNIQYKTYQLKALASAFINQYMFSSHSPH